MRYLLIGNYGVGNFGDEALKEYFLSAFPEVEWHILSAHPKQGELARLPMGLRSLFTPWWRTITVMRRSDGLVFGGGTLITDVESVRACLLWWWHALWAWIFRKRIFLAFQGIGPFKTRVGEWCAQWVVSRSVFVSVRDEASFRRVSSWGGSINVVQTFDPAILLFRKQKEDIRTQNLLCIIPRRNTTDSFLDRARILSRERLWGGVCVLSFQPDDPGEQTMCSRLAGETGGTVVPVRTVEDAKREISAASLVLSQRYHGLVAAMALGVPCESVSQGEGDKLGAIGQFSVSDECALLASKGEDALRMAFRAGI